MKKYIEECIIPRYESFDAAHRCDHVRYVISQSLELARHYEVNADMVYVIAAYHDTGLEVEALNGAPGVYSARYAGGEGHDSEANMQKLLAELAGKDNRQARFRTVIALIERRDVCPCGCTAVKKVTEFEGIVNGTITHEKHGSEGFGYDPVFQPEGYDHTFAELGVDVKNTISHRARATQKLADYLRATLGK